MNREIVGASANIYPLTGDVQSSPGSPTVTVVGLQTVPLVFSGLDDGDFLVYDGTVNNWVNRPVVIPPTIELQTNGVDNSSQTLLNITGTGGVVVTEAAGTVTINGSGAGGFTTKTSFNLSARNFVGTYTNTTGSTLFVSCSAVLASGGGGDFRLDAFTGPSGSPVKVQSSTCTSTITGQATNGISFMVLNGETYSVTVTDLTGSGVYNQNTWVEWN